ncbi:hypothetical protein BE15_03880 [Sorangium cellulosum]|uniref:YD repeat-containing protein n=2 Tax=Sorangium cellulosum TaxID=56 RepID=A0A150QDM2_SORCE|nr:hypothetical protein BE15_03880 [Sorangium cellulosum]
MVELVSPDAGRTGWRYDLAGNLRGKQTAELALGGQLIRYEYDFDRLRKIDYPVTQDVARLACIRNCEWSRSLFDNVQEGPARQVDLLRRSHF